MPSAILVQFMTPFEMHTIWQSDLFPPFIYEPCLQYNSSSGDLKSDHSKSVNIWNLNYLKVWLQMIQFSNGWASGFQISLEIKTICSPNSFFFNHLISRLILISDHRRIVFNEMLTWWVMANRSWQVLRSLQVFQVHRVEVRLEGLSRSCRRNIVRPRSPQQCPGWSPR